jgi:hypothetical protein
MSNDAHRFHCGKRDCGVEEVTEQQDCECSCAVCVETWAGRSQSLTQDAWVARFLNRTARLSRLVELDAPAMILDNERNLWLSAAVNLTPESIARAFQLAPEVIKQYAVDSVMDAEEISQNVDDELKRQN